LAAYFGDQLEGGHKNNSFRQEKPPHVTSNCTVVRAGKPVARAIHATLVRNMRCSSKVLAESLSQFFTVYRWH
jgi:hypothetical protein